MGHHEGVGEGAARALQASGQGMKSDGRTRSLELRCKGIRKGLAGSSSPTLLQTESPGQVVAVTVIFKKSMTVK